MTSPKKLENAIDDGRAASERSIFLLAAVVWIGLLIFHATKALHFYPLIVPDEYYYVYDSLLRSFPEMIFPQYLYYVICMPAGFFGEGRLDAARVINAAVFMLSAPFLYMTARRVASLKLSLFISAVALASPLSSYTAYFMPDSMYFTFFWIFAWLVVGRRQPDSSWGIGVIAGVAIAVAALIKVHAIFLLPGYALFSLLDETGDRRWKHLAQRLIAVVLGFAVVRFGLGYCFAGTAGIDLLGGNYNAIIEDSVAVYSPTVVLSYFFYNFLGNLLCLCLGLGPPLYFVVGLVVKGRSVSSSVGRMAAFGLALLLPLICVTAAFCSSMAILSPDFWFEEISRIQSRFYGFLFPLFLIVAIGVYSAKADAFQPSRLLRLLVGLPILLLGLYALLTRIRGYFPSSLPDCPEMGDLYLLAPWLFYPLFSLPVIGLVLVLLGERKGLFGFIFVYVPLHVAIVTPFVHFTAMNSYGVLPNLYDQAGMFARDYLGDECADLTVVDPTLNSGTKALIHIFNKQADRVRQETGVVVDMSRIRQGKKWLLIIGGLTVPPRDNKFVITYDNPELTESLQAVAEVYNMPQLAARYSLIRIADFDYSIDFRAERHQWPVVGITRTDDRIVIEYAIPLPKTFTLSLEADYAGFAYAVWPGKTESTSPLIFDGRQSELETVNSQAGDTLVIKRVDARGASSVVDGLKGVRRLTIREGRAGRPAGN